MTEEEVIKRSPLPITRDAVFDHLQKLGVGNNATLIVHASLSAIGWVAGGAQAVLLALLDSVSNGTLVMPSQSSQLSDPATWRNPPVPYEWIETLRASFPHYDPDITPSRFMGRLAELLLAHPQSVRSSHPTMSFCAIGCQADYITSRHSLTPAFGDTSPLGTLYELDADVLLLGVGYQCCTAIHLAEVRALWSEDRLVPNGAPILVDGERDWVTYNDLDYCSDEFEKLGAQFELEHAVQSRLVGQATSRLLKFRELVDCASERLARSP